MITANNRCYIIVSRENRLFLLVDNFINDIVKNVTILTRVNVRDYNKLLGVLLIVI